MKELLLSAITLRERLIRINKGYITGTQVEQFLRNLHYWLESGPDPYMIAERWDGQIRVILTKNFINKYNTLKNENNRTNQQNY